MKKVLVLGAGLVARPLVEYLLGQPDFLVVVADVEADRAAKLIGIHPRGRADTFDIADRTVLSAAIGRSDLVVSMVPNTFHRVVADLAIEQGKHMVTASYVGPAMRDLDARAKDKGVIILNELGLDPGIDHMEAMRIIHEVHNARGRVLSFTSWCGGLPAPEADTNPFGYKFSWSPRGVLLASKSAARFLKEGRILSIPAADLFADPEHIVIAGLDFEGYPNRDSVSYRETYGIPEALSILRGTLRYPGWCETLKKMVELGLLDDAPKDRSGFTFLDLMNELSQAAARMDAREAVAIRLGLEPNSAIISRLDWLGLFEPKRLPFEKGSILDNLVSLMIEKLHYAEGERDMIVLQHEFLIQTSSGRKERILSTLIDYGVPGGDSSMARMVGLPAGIGARLILEGKIRMTGIQVPVHTEVYGPILEELEKLGVHFEEERLIV